MPPVLASQVAVAQPPRLDVPGRRVALSLFADTLGADPRKRKAHLLLLDVEAINTSYALASLHVALKGWLCELDHKSCQHTCLSDEEWAANERRHMFGGEADPEPADRLIF